MNTGLDPFWAVDTVLYTVWKFHGFSIIQILREVNFRDSRSARSAILAHLEPQNFDFYEFLQVLKAEINLIQNPQN